MRKNEKIAVNCNTVEKKTFQRKGKCVHRNYLETFVSCRVLKTVREG